MSQPEEIHGAQALGGDKGTHPPPADTQPAAATEAAQSGGAGGAEPISAAPQERSHSKVSSSGGNQALRTSSGSPHGSFSHRKTKAALILSPIQGVGNGGYIVSKISQVLNSLRNAFSRLRGRPQQGAAISTQAADASAEGAPAPPADTTAAGAKAITDETPTDADKKEATGCIQALTSGLAKRGSSGSPGGGGSVPSVTSGASSAIAPVSSGLPSAADRSGGLIAAAEEMMGKLAEVRNSRNSELISILS